MMEDFVVVEELARSGKGTISKVRRRSDNGIFVLKERRSPELGRGKSILNEVLLLQKVKHPCLIELISHFWDGPVLYMQLEFAEFGDLHQEIKKRGREKEPFQNETICGILHSLCEGLRYLHKHRVIHRDIKSMNCFITATNASNAKYGIQGLVLGETGRKFALKIGDLGVSRECSMNTDSVATYCGTPIYASPEICENKPYSFETDIWSLGVLSYEIIQLRHPFQNKSLPALAAQICRVEYDRLPSSVNLQFQLVVKGMLQKMPSDRLTLDRIMTILKQSKLLSTTVKTTQVVAIPSIELTGNGILNKHEEKTKSKSPTNAKDKKPLTATAEAKLRRLETVLKRKQVKLKRLSTWDKNDPEITTLLQEIQQLKQQIEFFNVETPRSLESASYYCTCPIPPVSGRYESDKLCKTCVSEDAKKNKNTKATTTQENPKQREKAVQNSSTNQREENDERNNDPEERSRIKERSARLAKRLETFREAVSK